MGCSCFGGAWKTDSWDMLDVLGELPAKLDDLYGCMIGQIQNLGRRNPELCRLVLSAATLAYRPLALAELAIVSGLPRDLFWATRTVFGRSLLHANHSFRSRTASSNSSTSPLRITSSAEPPLPSFHLARARSIAACLRDRLRPCRRGSTKHIRLAVSRRNYRQRYNPRARSFSQSTVLLHPLGEPFLRC
jgi:hypothetical protein